MKYSIPPKSPYFLPYPPPPGPKSTPREAPQNSLHVGWWPGLEGYPGKIMLCTFGSTDAKPKCKRLIDKRLRMRFGGDGRNWTTPQKPHFWGFQGTFWPSNGTQCVPLPFIGLRVDTVQFFFRLPPQSEGDSSSLLPPPLKGCFSPSNNPIVVWKIQPTGIPPFLTDFLNFRPELVGLPT